MPVVCPSQYSPLYHLACSIPSFWEGHRKLMAIYTGYFDESADEEKPHLIMGGMILDAERAGDFDSDWRDAIRELPHLKGQPFLHTSDFVTGNKQYKPAWKGRYDEKLAILSGAARVINKYGLQVITTVVHMDDYRLFDSVAKVSESIGHPYSVGCILAYRHMEEWAKRHSIATPIKMVVESRDGTGDAVEMFRIYEYPIPAPEDKGMPQLQAADYIAWMRLKRYEPTPSYERVKDSWNEINQWLYTDETYGAKGLLHSIRALSRQIPGTPFPRREDDRTLVTYNNNRKKPRRPFKRPAPPKVPR